MLLCIIIGHSTLFLYRSQLQINLIMNQQEKENWLSTNDWILLLNMKMIVLTLVRLLHNMDHVLILISSILRQVLTYH